MKFTIPRSELARLLSTVVSAVPTRSTLPILSNVLFDVADEKVTLVATDLDISIRTSGFAETEAKGTITVPARRIADVVRELPDEPVRAAIKDQKMTLECGRGTFRIQGMSADEFPKLPDGKGEKKIALPPPVLERMIRRTSYAVSTEETRQILTGVLVQVREGQVRLVATDGHRLAQSAFRGAFREADAMDVVVPTKVLTLLARLLPEQSGEAVLSVAKNYAIFDLGETTLYTRLIEGTFPNYEQVIPKTTEKSVTVNREELIASLKRVSQLSDTMTRQVRLSLRRGAVELSVEAADIGEANDSIAADYRGEDFDAGYNAGYLLEVLKSMDTESATFRLNSAETAGVLVPEGDRKDEDLLCLVMPYRLAG
jgi:DNA polymerase-3 subunit beta